MYSFFSFLRYTATYNHLNKKDKELKTLKVGFIFDPENANENNFILISR